jgi:AAHS family 3-hydroxyphenylpropionic acid transporter
MMEIGAATTPRASNVNVTVALCLLCAVLEGFDIQARGVAAPRLLPEFGLSPSQMGWVFSVSNIGLVIGAALGGWLADRVGRKPVFIAAVATFGVFTLGVALASNFTMLFVLRFLAGLGFGGALPNMMAMATELSAPGKRAQTAAIMF